MSAIATAGAQHQATRAAVITVRASVEVLLNQDYGSENDSFGSLYAKSKKQQWDADIDLDWDREYSPANPLDMPDGTIAIYGSDVWRSLGDAQRVELRQHIQSWNLSQILHGEQAALICAARIAQSEPDVSGKLCAASQALDEARHVEAYSRLLTERFDVAYPISPSLKTLLSHVLSDSRLDFTCLGMQILIEGMALSIFQNLRAYSGSAFFCKLLTLVLRDEARHFAIGRFTLDGLLGELSAYELREREQFVVEAAAQLHEHLCADDVWEPLGMSRKGCGELVRRSPITASLRRAMFRRLVPTIRDMGLLGDQARRMFASVDVIDYAEYPALPS